MLASTILQLLCLLTICLLQFYTAVADQLTLAEIVDYTDCSPEPGGDVKLFGLTVEKLERCHPRKLVVTCYFDLMLIGIVIVALCFVFCGSNSFCHCCH